NIREWMEQNPDGANELRRQNRSYVFFREVSLSDKDEAVGAQGVPLTPGRSIAVDRALHVHGTPFFIEGELPIESEQSRTPFGRPWRKRGQKDRAHGQLCRGACGTRSRRGASFGYANGCRNTNPIAGSPAEHSTNPRGASLPPLSSSPPQPMKRSSTPTPDLPAAARRRRSLSEEERALWESVAKDTKPLRKKPLATKAQANSH